MALAMFGRLLDAEQQVRILAGGGTELDLARLAHIRFMDAVETSRLEEAAIVLGELQKFRTYCEEHRFHLISHLTVYQLLQAVGPPPAQARSAPEASRCPSGSR